MSSNYDAIGRRAVERLERYNRKRAADRIERVAAIRELMRESPGIKSSEVSARLSISLRTAQRYMRLA